MTRSRVHQVRATACEGRGISMVGTGGPRRDLALPSGIGDSHQDRGKRERQVAAMEHPLHLFVELEQDKTGIDTRCRNADSSGDLCGGVAAVQ